MSFVRPEPAAACAARAWRRRRLRRRSAMLVAVAATFATSGVALAGTGGTSAPGASPAKPSAPRTHARSHVHRARTASRRDSWMTSELRKIARCESGGDPHAISADGRFFGLYQFDLQTWRSLGGSGNPAQASAATQTSLARKLMKQRGTSPWPSCA